MKNLVFVTLVAAAASLSTGCIISSDDDDGGSLCGDFASGACLDIVVDCPPDATGFDVTLATGTESESCSVGRIGILVDPGTHDLTVTPTSADFTFASDADTVTAADGDTVLIDFSTWPTGGFMAMTWTIDDSPPATGCADLQSGGVSSLATLIGSSEAYEDLFNCEDGAGVTSEIPLGDYTVVFALLDQNDASIADSEPREVNLVVEDQLEDLGNFNFVTQ